jgi:hypothetical protein
MKKSRNTMAAAREGSYSYTFLSPAILLRRGKLVVVE